MCMHCTVLSAYMYLVSRVTSKDTIPQVIFNNKALQLIAACAVSELNTGEQEWEAGATIQLFPRTNSAGDNDKSFIPVVGCS